MDISTALGVSMGIDMPLIEEEDEVLANNIYGDHSLQNELCDVSEQNIEENEINNCENNQNVEGLNHNNPLEQKLICYENINDLSDEYIEDSQDFDMNDLIIINNNRQERIHESNDFDNEKNIDNSVIPEIDQSSSQNILNEKKNESNEEFNVQYQEYDEDERIVVYKIIDDDINVLEDKKENIYSSSEINIEQPNKSCKRKIEAVDDVDSSTRPKKQKQTSQQKSKKKASKRLEVTSDDKELVIVKQKNKEQMKFAEITKIIRKKFNLDNIVEKKKKALDLISEINIDFLLDKLVHSIRPSILESFENELYNNETLNKYLEEYCRHSVFMPFEVLHSNYTNIKKKVFESKISTRFTKLNWFNIEKLQQECYNILFGSKFLINNFLFKKYDASTFVYFIHRKLHTFRPIYSFAPEMVCIELLISPCIELETLIKIYFYLQIIDKLQTERFKVLIIIDEILNLLNKSENLRNVLENDFEPTKDVYSDIMLTTYNFLSPNARKKLFTEIKKYDGSEEILKLTLTKDLNKIIHKALILLIIKAFCFAEGDISELEDFIKEYSLKYYDLKPCKSLEMTIWLYNLIIKYDKNSISNKLD
ncbi:hypothetical protein NGRA_2238 [Nosema granulosis]|uniref:Uncharacterized protein n=1 Tax=Nosema granulosis TaxID=83296 RepID=A0A9P6GX22_9MICR|nr:hypothetical protein NGRA_2238 [Nosema granulosis]